MRAAILARVSTEEQAAGERLSMPAQLRVMRERCVREGWEVVEEYLAPGESAFTSDIALRPVLGRVLEDARLGRFDLLLVHESSRLARNERMAHEVLDLLTARGIALVNVGSTIDYTSPEGRMFFGVEASLNAYWSRKMSEHIRKGYSERFERGLSGGDVPFGYRWVASDKAPVVVEDEAAAIRKGFSDYGQGKGFQAIAGEWNALGLRPHSKRGLVSFTPSSVQSVIENRFYAGFVSHLGEERVGAHEAILSESDWASANGRTRRQGTHSRASFGALMTGLTECAECGGPVWSSWSGPNRVVYYFEASRRRGRSCAHAGRRWRAEDADAAVAKLVRGMALEGEWFAEARRLASRPGGPSVERERSRLVERRRRVTAAYTAGAMEDAEWRAELAGVDSALGALPVASGVSVLRAGQRLSDMAAVWDEWTPAERNAGLRILFEGVRLDVVGKGLWVKPASEFAGYFGARRGWVQGSGEGGCTPDRTRTPLVPSAFWYSPQELAA